MVARVLMWTPKPVTHEDSDLACFVESLRSGAEADAQSLEQLLVVAVRFGGFMK